MIIWSHPNGEVSYEYELGDTVEIVDSAMGVLESIFQYAHNTGYTVMGTIKYFTEGFPAQSMVVQYSPNMACEVSSGCLNPTVGTAIAARRSPIGDR